MMYRYIFLLILILFTGCSNKILINDEKTIKERSTSFKEYPNITKDSILEAAKKVFILADKKEFRIDSYRDKLVVSKTKMSHYPLFVNVHEDFWEMNIEEKDNISRANLVLYRIKNHNDEDIKFIDKDTHELFWNRIEYLLGLTDDWESCRTNWEFTQALCDSVDLSDYKDAKKEDKIEKVLISNRNLPSTLSQKDDDILKEDIELTLDDTKEDILDNQNEKNNEQNIESNKDLDDIDKVIEELDKKVNENIDNTLDKIKEEVVDEPIDSKE